MQPLVSILIPAYNAEAWLGDTIRSALAQTWPRKEIIIVDDGSKDRTLTVAGQFASSAVKVVTQPNGGASSARNHAYSLAQGDFIQWLDADDVLDPSKIERQMLVALSSGNPRTLYSGAWAYFFYRTEKARFNGDALWCDLTPTEFLIRKMGQNLHMQPDAWLVSRELTDAAGPWDTSLWRDNDGEYFCRVILASDGLRFVPDARSYYRRSGRGSISYVGTSQKKIESLYRSINLHIGYLRSLEDSTRTRAASLAYLKTWQFVFYPERMDLVERLRNLAVELGGTLPPPILPWKYRPIQKLFGWKVAKYISRTMPFIREGAARGWDRIAS